MNNLNTYKTFWSYVKKTRGCWKWTGPMLSQGYGRMSMNHIAYRAHRLSYKIHFGNIPKDKLVCHKCDNRICVNPKHLFLGSALDNVRDKIKKGRQFYPKGELHFCKLNEADVIKIRKTYKRRIVTQQFLATKYGVSRENIGRILRRSTWTHI